MTESSTELRFSEAENVTTERPFDDKSGKLSSIETHFIIVTALAVLCFILAGANILVHYMVKRRMGPWRYQVERNRRNLATISAQIERYNKKESVKAGTTKTTQILFAKHEYPQKS